MNNYILTHLFAILLLFFNCDTIFAGTYEYSFTGKVFDGTQNTVNLTGYEWNLFINGSTNFEIANFGYSQDYGQKISSYDGNKLINIALCTEAFSNKRIKSVTITTTTSATSAVDCSVKVGDSSYKCNNIQEYPIEKKSATYRFIGEGQGKISITWKQKAKNSYIYIRKIAIEYTGSDDRADQNLAFPQSTYTAILEEGFTLPEISGNKTDLSYSSSNPDIASIDAQTGQIELKATGQTIITAHAIANEEYNSAKAHITLNVKKQLTHNTLFDFTQEENCGLAFPQNGKPAYLTVYSLNSDDIVITCNDINNYYRNSNKTIRLKLYKGKNITFTAPSGMTIKSIRFTGENLSEIQSDGKNISENTWTGNANSVTITTTTQVVSLASASIEYEGAYKQNISAVGYATLSTAQDYVMPEGLKGGIVTVKENTAYVHFCYLPGDIVPAQEPLVLKGTVGEYILKPSATTQTRNTENQLLAASNNDSISAGSAYKLFILSLDQEKKIGFYYQKGCHDGSYLKDIAHKAYLKLPQTMFENPQKGLRLNIEPTGINSPTHPSQEQGIYHLKGYKINNPQSMLPKGIYIINGKKIYIK